MTFWALFEHFHFKKIEIFTFSGSTIVWSNLGEYERFKVLLWKGKGRFSVSYGPKLVNTA